MSVKLCSKSIPQEVIRVAFQNQEEYKIGELKIQKSFSGILTLSNELCVIFNDKIISYGKYDNCTLEFYVDPIYSKLIPYIDKIIDMMFESYFVYTESIKNEIDLFVDQQK